LASTGADARARQPYFRASWPVAKETTLGAQRALFGDTIYRFTEPIMPPPYGATFVLIGMHRVSPNEDITDINAASKVGKRVVGGCGQGAGDSRDEGLGSGPKRRSPATKAPGSPSNRILPRQQSESPLGDRPPRRRYECIGLAGPADCRCEPSGPAYRTETYLAASGARQAKQRSGETPGRGPIKEAPKLHRGRRGQRGSRHAPASRAIRTPPDSKEVGR